MKLFLKQSSSAENIIFIIYDELGNEKYKVLYRKRKANISYHINTIDDKTVCVVRKIPITTTNSYIFKLNNKRITFVCVPAKDRIKCRYYGINRHIIGDAFNKNFSVVEVDNSVVFEHIRVLADVELNIVSDDEEMFAIATAVCINLINTVDNLATLAV